MTPAEKMDVIVGDWLRDLEDSERKTTAKDVAYWLLYAAIVVVIFLAVAE